jgi:hypothetical protein
MPSQQGSMSSNFRQRKLAVADTMRLDTVSIIPRTLSIAGVPDSEYHFDFIKAILTWRQKPSADSVLLIYRVFPFK